MNARAAGRVAWPLWSLTMVLTASGLISSLAFVRGLSQVIVVMATVVFVLAFATVGALIMQRRSDNPIGWLMSCAALCYGVGALSEAYTRYSEVLGRPPLPGGALIDQVGGWIWTVGLALGGIFALLLFPDGHPPSRRWRPAVWAAGAGLALFVVGSVTAPGPTNGYFGADNPTGIPAAADLAGFLKGLGVALILLCVLMAVASLIARWRSSPVEQRQQLKWLLYAAMVIVTGVPISALIESLGSGEDAVDLANAAVTFALAAVPIATGVAILRHRLYDIDRIINRTLVYASLTGVLGLVYVAGVVGVGSVVRGVTSGAESSSVVVAASTLAVAALFRPARTHLQDFIDRRFYRRRYDAIRTVEVFSARLRDEVALEALKVHLLRAVRDTVQPTHVSIWLRDGTED